MQITYRNIFKITYPILISMLMEQLIGITDVIYMGRLGAVALGASALGSTYFMAVFMVAFGFTIGAQIVMARRNGEGEFAKIGPVFYESNIFLFSFSAFCIVLSKFFSPFFLKLFIDDPAVYEATLSYIDWRMWGLFGISLMMMSRAFFVSIAQTKILTGVSVFMVLTNIVLNYFFIFGAWKFPEMGISGAALASNISELVACVIFGAYYFKKINLKKYALNKPVLFDFKVFVSVLKVSVWSMLQHFITFATWFMFFIAIEHLGTEQLAVANILKSVAAFPFVVIHALATTAGTLVSNLIGENKSEMVLKTTSQVVKLCVWVVLPLLLLMALFYAPLLRIYTSDKTLLNLSILPYFVMLGSFLPMIFCWIWFNVSSGTGNTKYSVVIETFATAFYALFIVIFILQLKVPLFLCFFADWVYNLVVLVLSYNYLHSGKWKNKNI